MGKNIDSLIEEFQQQSKQVKEDLTELLIVVADGKVPEADAMKTLTSEVDQLRYQYEVIYQFAKESVYKDELPTFGSSVKNLADTVKNSRAKWVQEQLTKAQSILQQFIHVRSRIVEYAELLKPYQSEAADLLKEMTEDTFESLLPQTIAPEMFVEAVNFSNIHTPDGIELIKKLGQYYPLEVQLGLSGNQYYMDNLNTAEYKKLSVENTGFEVNEDQSHNEFIADSQPVVLAAEEAVDTEFHEHQTDLDVSEEISELSENALKTEADHAEKNLIAVNKDRIIKSKPRANDFIKQIRKICGYPCSLMSIFPLFSRFGVLTKEQIYACSLWTAMGKNKEININTISNIVDNLANKGYLCCFVRTTDYGEEMFYCLSKYSYNCMNKESVLPYFKQQWSVKPTKTDIISDGQISEPLFNWIINYNEVLIEYLKAEKEVLNEKDYLNLLATIDKKDQHYLVRITDNGTVYRACLVAPLMDVAALNEEYLLFVNDYVKIPEKFNAICVKVFWMKGNTVDIIDPKQDIFSQVVERPKQEETEQSKEPIENLPQPEEPVENLPQPEEPVENLPQPEEPVENLPQPEEPVENLPQPEEPVENLPQLEDQLEEQSVDSAPDDKNVLINRLIKSAGEPSDDDILKLIHENLNRSVSSEKELQSVIVQAVLLARGAGQNEKIRPQSKKLACQLELATHLLVDHAQYRSEELSEAFEESDGKDFALMLAAYMNAMLAPVDAYDYGLNTQKEKYFSCFDHYFVGLSSFKPMFSLLKDIAKINPEGFTPTIVSLLDDHTKIESVAKSLKEKAAQLLTINRPHAGLRDLPALYHKEFDKDSDLYKCMQNISAGKEDANSLEMIEIVLLEFCMDKQRTYQIDDDKLNSHVDKVWLDITHKKQYELLYSARNQVVNQYKSRLEIMISWWEYIQSRNTNSEGINRLKNMKVRLLELISDLQRDTSWRTVEDANVLAWMLYYMKAYLNNRLSKLDIYSDLLHTGIFSLKDDGVPDLDDTLNNIRYYEIWRNALRHMVTPIRSFDQVVSKIIGDESQDDHQDLKDNLHQLEMIGKWQKSRNDIFEVCTDDLRDAENLADEHVRRFQDELEMAYCYNRINEDEKESLIGIINQYKNRFYQVKDFACWRRFLDALQMQLIDLSNEKKKELHSSLMRLLNHDRDCLLLKEAERLLSEESNVAVAEEYISRYNSGERSLDLRTSQEIDYFADFISPNVFNPLYEICNHKKGGSLISFGTTYIHKNAPKNWSTHHFRDSDVLIKNWSVRKDTVDSYKVIGLLQGLQINAQQAVKMENKTEEIWQISVTPEKKSLADYPHPIAAFGTQMKSPMYVVFLYGNFTEQQLVEKITKLNLGKYVLVFLDRFLSIAQRRKIGEIFRTSKTGQNSFLLIDQVLFLYLALLENTQRLQAMLKCTLPFTAYQPFVRENGAVADEMFCGRKKELQTIIDPQGACVVYGGRQLGKTALLQRVESLCSNPEDKKFAVYASIVKQTTEEEVVYTLAKAIDFKTNHQILLKPCKTFGDMCDQLGEMFKQGQLVSLHLLIDEVDSFLDAISEGAYNQLQPLVDLRRTTGNSFKFVIAGLHNVCRAEKATANNGVFGQLGQPICIAPLSPQDALELLSRPLRYLGFKIDKDFHLETILTNTNYYPGILQFFGYKLVETLSDQYDKYYSASMGNPPFTLQDEQLGAILNSADLNSSIKEKFRLSLNLDPRYFMIARCITMLYHLSESDRWLGFSVENIKEVADDYDIYCLKHVSKNDYLILLDEMVAMGILGKPDKDKNRYRLRRNSFIDIIGKDMDIVEDDIKQNNKNIDQTESEQANEEENK